MFISPTVYVSTKGTLRLLYDGINFSKNYQNGNRISWRCNKVGCLARVTKIHGHIVGFKNGHNHDHDVYKKEHVNKMLVTS